MLKTCGQKNKLPRLPEEVLLPRALLALELPVALLLLSHLSTRGERVSAPRDTLKSKSNTLRYNTKYPNKLLYTLVQPKLVWATKM